MAEAALSSFLRDNRPVVNTGHALLAVDLQKDFLAGHGKLPVTLMEGFKHHFPSLVSSFRTSGPIIWVRSEYSATQDTGADAIVTSDPLASVDDTEPEEEDSEDEFIRNKLSEAQSPLGNRPSGRRTAELLKRAAAERAKRKSRSATKPVFHADLFLAAQDDADHQCCITNSVGAQLADLALSLLESSKDFVVTKNSYSAFNSTSLLMTLRLQMISRLYICGSLTNVSVYATAADAASHGFEVMIIEDCLGYRSEDAHEQALNQMVDVIGAERALASDLINELTSSSGVDLSVQHAAPTEKEHQAVPIDQLESLTLHSTAASESSTQPSFNAADIRPEGVGLSRLIQLESEATGSSSQAVPLQRVADSKASTFREQADSALVSSTQPETVPVTTTEAAPLSQATRPTASPLVGSSPAAGDGQTTSLEAQSGLTIRPSERKRDRTTETLLKRPGDIIAEGDSSIVYDFIPHTGSNLFSSLKNEVYWQKMLHAQGEVPRLVCAQGVFGPDGSMPIYRHPSDQSLPLLHFSPGVENIKNQVEKVVGHPMNHVLIQLYRSGDDFISEHSDKTLDIVPGSSIVNVSIGAQRTMRLRTKRLPKEERDESLENTRQTQLVPMPHNSMFVLGLQSNSRWLHSIKYDKRPISQKTEAETAFGGERISLTFRQIGTFLDSNSEHIWGQGATAKTQDQANRVINGDSEKTQELINAFGYENQQTLFDWNAVYGKGFDVLHFGQHLDETPLFFHSGNNLQDIRVKIMLEDLGVAYRSGGVQNHEAGKDYSPDICFRDTDTHKTQVYGDIPILLYLDRMKSSKLLAGPLVARLYEQLYGLRDVLGLGTRRTLLVKLEEVLHGRDYLAGSDFTLVDCAYWPVVDEIVQLWEPWNPNNFPNVAEYHRLILARPTVQGALRDRHLVSDGVSAQ